MDLMEEEVLEDFVWGCGLSIVLEVLSACFGLNARKPFGSDLASFLLMELEPSKAWIAFEVTLSSVTIFMLSFESSFSTLGASFTLF